MYIHLMLHRYNMPALNNTVMRRRVSKWYLLGFVGGTWVAVARVVKHLLPKTGALSHFTIAPIKIQSTAWEKHSVSLTGVLIQTATNTIQQIEIVLLIYHIPSQRCVSRARALILFHSRLRSANRRLWRCKQIYLYHTHHVKQSTDQVFTTGQTVQ